MATELRFLSLPEAQKESLKTLASKRDEIANLLGDDKSKQDIVTT